MDLNLGETIMGVNKKRFLLTFNSNSKLSNYGGGCDFRYACWTGKGLIEEVNEKGKRRVMWDYKTCGPKFF